MRTFCVLISSRKRTTSAWKCLPNSAGQETIRQLSGAGYRVIALRDNQECKKIAEIPGVGLLTATAAVAAIGDAKTFRSGREFAAWLGLVPKQTGTGGHVRQLGISKRGDTYLRTLLIHGARSVVIKGARTAWLDGLLQRRPFNVVVAAVANKLARTIWAVLARDTRYTAPAMAV